MKAKHHLAHTAVPKAKFLLQCCPLTASVPVALMYTRLSIPTSTLHHRLTACHFKVSVFPLSGLFPHPSFSAALFPSLTHLVLHTLLSSDGLLPFLQILRFCIMLEICCFPPTPLLYLGKPNRYGNTLVYLISDFLCLSFTFIHPKDHLIYLYKRS